MKKHLNPRFYAPFLISFLLFGWVNLFHLLAHPFSGGWFLQLTLIIKLVTGTMVVLPSSTSIRRLFFGFLIADGLLLMVSALMPAELVFPAALAFAQLLVLAATALISGKKLQLQTRLQLPDQKPELSMELF